VDFLLTNISVAIAQVNLKITST